MINWKTFDSMRIFSMMLFLGASLIFVSCGSDDEASSADCTIFVTLDGDVEINGDELQLSIAQSIVSAGGGGFGDMYLFQIGGVSNDCNELLSVNFTLMVPTGMSPTGTYDIRSFFDADDDDATGSFGRQSLDPVSQSSVDMNSGSVSITENGANNFTIDLNAGTATGEDVSLNITHQF